MHMVKLSETYGINLDHVVEWYDIPEIATPRVSVWFSVGSQTEFGERQPHMASLTGEERDMFLRWIEMVSRPSYHHASA